MAIALAKSFASLFLNKKPVLSFIIVSFEPPISLAITGSSIAWASTATLPKASGCVIVERALEGMPEGAEVEVLLYDEEPAEEISS